MREFLLSFFLTALFPSVVCWMSSSESFIRNVHSKTRWQAATSTPETSTDDVQRNMFFQYDEKPILFVGCSGSGNELERVARAFLAQQSSADESDLIYLSRMDDKGGVMLEGGNILESMQEKTLGWPRVIMADFGCKCFAGDPSNQLQEHFTETVKALYSDHDVLSVFVNVHPTESNMAKATADRKTQLEEDVLVKYSDFELCIKGEGVSTSNEEWEHIEWELSRLVARAKLVPAVPGDTSRSENTAHLTMGDHTFFLSLSFPEISQVKPYIEEMCLDVDAMEYRTDLLDCRDSRFDLIYGMQLLRRFCRPHVVRVPVLACGKNMLEDVMPIVYTVRTAHQAGTYPDDADGISKMFHLLEWGLRAGSEVLDVESAWDKSRTDALLSLAEKRYASQILGSHHVVGEEISTESAIQLFQQCALDGRAHGAKVVLSIDSSDRDRMAYEAALLATSLAESANKPVIPNISLILGDVGQFSRVLNFPFTPVTHESLPFKAAPGQLSASEIMTTRLLTNVLKKKVFGILGHNIAYSVSPQMHGSAFGATRLPHKYVRIDVPTVQEFIESDFFLGEGFGGASVTIPHKQSILPYVDVLSEAAKEIGSCNTLIAKEEVDEANNSMKRVIYGDNTDWKGIFNPLNRLLGGGVNPESDYALILGAGGTARAAAYVADRLRMRRLYYNRTPEKANDLVDSFGGIVVGNLDVDGDETCLGNILRKEKGSVRVVISTLPAAANFALPEWLVELKPIVFDVNYKPYQTELLRQAEGAGLAIVRGSEMLWEQGVSQFEMWTNRTAPYGVMKEVVLVNCLPSEDVEEP